MERFFLSVGTLRYSYDPKYGYRLALDIDKGIGLFYKSLIPRWFQVNGQKYDPHITVVRYEVPPNLEAWGKYEGERVEFLYDPYIFKGTQYWWLDCFSKRLEEIREELGLPLPPASPSSDFRQPIDGFSKVFHTTIANHKPPPKADSPL
jgi:hypothetical protein